MSGTDMASITDTIRFDINFGFGYSLIPIEEINCQELGRDKTYDYYKKMIDYKVGFLQSCDSFIQWGWFQYTLPWLYSLDMQNYIDTIKNVYLCAIQNNASKQVVFNNFDPKVTAMYGYFDIINTWWHPGIVIGLNMIPTVGPLIAYTYLLLGLTLFKSWGVLMKTGIDVLVPPYKDVITLEYTEFPGLCKRKDDKTSTLFSDLNFITTLQDCKAQCDINAPYCTAYSWSPNAATSKCVIWKEIEALVGDENKDSKCFVNNTVQNNCPDYQIPSVDKQTCVEPICSFRDIISPSGQCSPCGDYLTPDRATRTACIAPQCMPGQIVTIQGQCSQCGSYQIVDANQRNCIKPPCTARQVIRIDGTCETCGNYLTPQYQQYCITRWDCDPRTPVTIDGECATTDYVCEDYQALSLDKRSCEIPKCSSNQYINKDGTCANCPDYMISSGNKNGISTCIITTCAADKITNRYGSCGDPVYTSGSGKCWTTSNNEFTSIEGLVEKSTANTQLLCQTECTADAQNCKAYYFKIGESVPCKLIKTSATIIRQQPASVGWTCYLSNSRGGTL